MASSDVTAKVRTWKARSRSHAAAAQSGVPPKVISVAMSSTATVRPPADMAADRLAGRQVSCFCIVLWNGSRIRRPAVFLRRFADQRPMEGRPNLIGPPFDLDVVLRQGRNVEPGPRHHRPRFAVSQRSQEKQPVCELCRPVEGGIPLAAFTRLGECALAPAGVEDKLPGLTLVGRHRESCGRFFDTAQAEQRRAKSPPLRMASPDQPPTRVRPISMRPPIGPPDRGRRIPGSAPTSRRARASGRGRGSRTRAENRASGPTSPRWMRTTLHAFRGRRHPSPAVPRMT